MDIVQENLNVNVRLECGLDDHVKRMYVFPIGSWMDESDTRKGTNIGILNEWPADQS